MALADKDTVAAEPGQNAKSAKDKLIPDEVSRQPQSRCRSRGLILQWLECVNL